MHHCSMQYNLYTVYIIHNNLWKTQEDNTLSDLPSLLWILLFQIDLAAPDGVIQ